MWCTVQSHGAGDLFQRHPPVVTDKQILCLLKECLGLWVGEGGESGEGGVERGGEGSG